MGKWLRRTAITLGVSLPVSALSSYSFYRAATELPEEYEAVLRVEPEKLEEGRKELESQISSVYSEAVRPIEPDVSHARKWQTSVTDEQINGWLATRLAQEFPEAQAEGLVDPRVMFGEDGLTLAFRVDRGLLNAVVQLRVAPFLSDDGRLGVELAETHIGSVPLPTGKIVEASRGVFADAGLPLEWAQVEGRPALLIDFEQLASDAQNRRVLKGIELADGQLSVAGQTERRPARLAQRQ